ncbi:uncharacterized protein OCT59_023377 [Rhizophagus irregularis]|uniref:uncharacterized protein n=1 Tax=Rhizophagus irregularis TaxID=588596 RepID=UPI001A00505E|nr:hypothetical protein OCT59_023377 [Rhizophagus irregularis]GBC20289.2 hypothetical protein GLOIN_2v1848416 [Rhizophagus irregularis DAOM 181602=DAOM 197198]
MMRNDNTSDEKKDVPVHHQNDPRLRGLYYYYILHDWAEKKKDQLYVRLTTRPTLNLKSCINSSVPLSRIENFDLAQEDFENNNKTEITYKFPKIGRKYTNKCENKEVNVNVNNQSRKKSKNHRAILENTIQKWIE